MISVPLVVVWLTSNFLYFKLPTVAALLLSLVLSWACAAIASRIWERRSKTAEISFSELMIWSWYRLQKAEREIERGVRATENPGSHDEQVQVLHELAAALESKDPYTRGHSRRVERHSFKTGVALGLPLGEVDVLRMSASLHDVGKIRVPNSVLHKPGALTEEERVLIQEHPALGAEMVASIGVQSVVDAVRHHHERWDGRGYPEGKAGEDIPLFARVIAVADSYDAIRSHRSYRRGSSRDEAVQVLTDESGTQFDGEVVDAFLSTLPARGRSVAALTSLATGPSALWRYLAQLFKRFGSTAIAPAIGAAGAAVIVGSSALLGPATPPPASPASDVARAAASPGERGSSASDASEATARERAAAQARADRRLAAAQARADRRQAERRRERRAARRQEDRTVVSATGGSGSDSPSTATQEPSTSAPAPTQPAPAPDAAGSQGTDGDPNAKGKDCEGKNTDSKGGRLHCG